MQDEDEQEDDGSPDNQFDMEDGQSEFQKIGKFFDAPTTGGSIRVKINRYIVAEDVVNYFITFYEMKTQYEWTFRTRYSEIRNMHEALKD